MTDRTPNGAASPGWYDDPSGGQEQRYWDGSGWTDHTRMLASDGSSPSRRGWQRPALLAAAFTLVLLVGLGGGLLLAGQRGADSSLAGAALPPAPDSADDPASELTEQDGGDSSPSSEEVAGDIEVEQHEGAIYLYYSLRVEDGEQVDEVLGMQLDGARRVSQALSDHAFDASTYCVGDDLLMVFVGSIDESVEGVISDVLLGDFEPSIFTSDVADFSWDSLVQCQARDGEIVRQGGSGTFP